MPLGIALGMTEEERAPVVLPGQSLHVVIYKHTNRCAQSVTARRCCRREGEANEGGKDMQRATGLHGGDVEEGDATNVRRFAIFARQPDPASTMTSITDRVERELGVPGIASLLAERLEPSDLQSLLLDVYRRVAKRRPMASVLGEYRTNRFVRPSTFSPVEMLDWDRAAFSALPSEFTAVDLSPVCPLGASTTIGGLAQDRAVTTIRNTEVVSDSTNVLALEAAIRRRAYKRSPATSDAPVHLAASHRLLRAQHYDNPKLSAHFKVFSLCSAGRDRGGYAVETGALGMHIATYLAAMRAFLGSSIQLRVLLTVLDPSPLLAEAAEALLERVRRESPDVDAAFEPTRTVGRGYYRTLCFWIYGVIDAEEPMQLVDGGCVDWTQRLLSDAKERLVISGIGSDRVCGIRRDLERSRPR